MGGLLLLLVIGIDWHFLKLIAAGNRYRLTLSSEMCESPVKVNGRFLSQIICLSNLYRRHICSRLPRWTSSSLRMLIVLVREFASRRGEILNLFAKIEIQKGSTDSA